MKLFAYLSLGLFAPTVLADPVAVANALVTPVALLRVRSENDLAKRQLNNPDFCGYIDGDPAYPITCPVICAAGTSIGWFGCCPSSINVGGTAEPADCSPKTGCAPYTAAAPANPSILHCSNAASPDCVQFTEVGLGLTDWICASGATTVDVYATTLGAGAAPSNPGAPTTTAAAPVATTTAAKTSVPAGASAPPVAPTTATTKAPAATGGAGSNAAPNGLHLVGAGMGAVVAVMEML